MVWFKEQPSYSSYQDSDPISANSLPSKASHASSEGEGRRVQIPDRKSEEKLDSTNNHRVESTIPVFITSGSIPTFCLRSDWVNSVGTRKNAVSSRLAHHEKARIYDNTLSPLQLP